MTQNRSKHGLGHVTTLEAALNIACSSAAVGSTVESLKFLVDIGRSILPMSTVEVQLLFSRVTELLSERIICAEADVVDSFVQDREYLKYALEILSIAGLEDASKCLLISIDFADEDPDFEKLCLKRAFNLEIDGNHSWVRSSNVREERVLMNELVVPSVSNVTGEASAFRGIKSIEHQYLKRFGRSPTAQQTLERISSVSNSHQTTLVPDVDGNAVSDDRESKHRRLSVVHPLQAVLQSLAFHAPAFYEELVKRDRQAVVQALYSLRRFRPVYMVISYLSYPMGGGESFMHQTCRILGELGYRCVWVSFSEKGKLIEKDGTAQTPFFEEIKISGGISEEKIEAVVQKFRPDLIHTHGASNVAVVNVATRWRIPTLVGFHFWGGLVRLNEENGNREILRFAPKHKAEIDLLKAPSSIVSTYVASEFMLEVYRKTGGRRDHSVFHPVPDPSHYLLDAQSLGDKVVQVNIAAGKGGQICLECIETLGHQVPFYVVQSEPGSENLDQRIEDAIKRSPRSEFKQYGPIKDHLKKARMVIVPTLVDETFCRIAFEAAANGIPVLCTACGFLQTLLGGTGVFLSDKPQDWIAKIRELYEDESRLRAIGDAQRKYIIDQFGLYPRRFIEAAIEMTRKSPYRNLGLFLPWSEQGLGEVGRTYAGVFRRLGLRAHVFSYQAYSARNRSVATQEFPDDWSEGEFADSVHYSLNDREHVTLHELGQFSAIHNVGWFIYPEICYHINWQKISNFKMSNLKVIAVPMVETARSSEVLLHNGLDHTWFNTRQSERVLRKAGVTNGAFVGHGFGLPLSSEEISRKIEAALARDRIVFCHVGGHNPLSRKQTGKVISAFKLAAKKRSDIFLKVCIMGGFADGVTSEPHAAIEFDYRTKRHDEIVELYATSDVSVQVSSHEGLGLGFYESVSVGTPVISLDLPPHNEVVHDGISGWLLPVKKLKLTDNDEALVDGGVFEVEQLAALFETISREDVARLIAPTAGRHSSGLSEVDLSIKVAAFLSDVTEDLKSGRVIRQ